MSKPKLAVAGLYEVQLGGPDGKTPTFVHMGGMGPQVPDGLPIYFIPHEMPIGARIAILAPKDGISNGPVPTVEEVEAKEEEEVESPAPEAPATPPTAPACTYKVGDDVMVHTVPEQLEVLVKNGYPQPDYRDEGMVAWKARVMPEAMTDHIDGTLAIQLDKDRRNNARDETGKVAIPQILRMPLQYISPIPEGHPLGEA